MQEKITEVKNKIVVANNNIPKEIDYSEKIMTLKRAIVGLKDDKLEPIEKNKLLKTIVKRIEYSNTSKRSEWGVNNITLDVFLQL